MRLPERFAAHVWPALTEFAIGAGAAVAAAAARLALTPVMNDRAPYALMFVAVVCATLFAGWRSGLAATLIGQGLAWFLVVRPNFSFELPGKTDAASLFIVTLSQLLIVAIVALYQREIARHERIREMLVNELNHRVKNTLAIVQSIAYQTLSDRSHEEVALFDGRLKALATAHSLLSQSKWNDANLREVIKAALAPFSIPSERITMAGPEVFVTPKAAVNLTLVMHELATNALKYGALKNGEGKVHIEWAEGHHLPRSFCWEESGGPPVTRPTRKGFGTRLIERGLAAELEAKVHMTFEPTGLVCRIERPVSG